MNKYRVFVTGRTTAEHSCDCECCTLAAVIELNAAYEAIVDAVDVKAARALALSGVYDALEQEIPHGYGIDDDMVETTLEVKELDTLALARLSGHPVLPGFGGAL